MELPGRILLQALRQLAKGLLHEVDGIQRRPPTGLLFHSDRVVQYASGDFRDALQAASLVPSMSRKANGYDNAAMESFWATLKLGLVYRTRLLTHADAHQQILDYIARFYNTQRLHSALGYPSPAQFDQQSYPKESPHVAVQVFEASPVKAVVGRRRKARVCQ